MSVTAATPTSSLGTPPPVPTTVPTAIYGTLPATAQATTASRSTLSTWLHRLVPIGLGIGGAAAGFFLLGGLLPAAALGVGGLAVGLIGSKLIKK